MIVNLSSRDDFVSVRLVKQFVDSAANGFRRTDGGAASSLRDRKLLRAAPMAIHGVDWWWKLAGMATNQIQELKLARSEKSLGGSVRIRRENADADHGVRFRLRLGWLEITAIEFQSDVEVVGSEVRGKSKRKSELGRKARAEVARAKKIKRNI